MLTKIIWQLPTVVTTYLARTVTGSIAAAVMVTLGACAQMPKEMRVDTGTDPEHAERNVRFRNTYYYRVFDFCDPHAPAKLSNSTEGHPVYAPTAPNPVVLSDSLYRFRMTGKANALYTKVHFESGILNATEIDPFGARVTYDEDADSFRYVSRDATEQSAARNQRRRELQRMLALRTQLQEADIGVAESEQAIRDLVKSLAPQSGAGASNKAGVAKLDLEKALAATASACPPGFDQRRGYQIMGPEGWRSFNQDERLVMAMSTSDKPLINTLQELSGRLLNQQVSRGDRLLPFAEARISVLRAQQTLQTADDDIAVLIDTIIKTLGQEGTTP